MITIIIIVILAIVYWLMLKSKSNFFYQTREILAEKRHHLISVLEDFRLSQKEIDKYLEAYNFFCANPSQFDGATIVKDLDTIKGLDAPAMLHDFNYIFLKNIKEKLFFDWQYAINQEKLRVGSVTAYTRSIGLIISTPLYYLIKPFKSK